MVKYWAAKANPNIYDIEQAVKELEINSLTTKHSRVSIGDRLFIWKTLGDSKNRGIVCFGEVLSEPSI